MEISETNTPDFGEMDRTLAAGSCLCSKPEFCDRGQWIRSERDAHDAMEARMQGDGNFVVSWMEGDDRYPKWSTDTVGHGKYPHTITLFANGDLVLRDADNVLIWQNTLVPGATTQPCRMIMQRDGNLVIYDAANRVKWNTNTAGQTHD
jgi:hypothetical protein